MAKVFLDTNTFIDAVYRDKSVLEELESFVVYYSPLSMHILFYALKIKVPSAIFPKIVDKFQIVDFTQEILNRAQKAPTKDLEDNVQLQSALEVNCDYFLTNDKKLLKIKFLGKTQIVRKLPR